MPDFWRVKRAGLAAVLKTDGTERCGVRVARPPLEGELDRVLARLEIGALIREWCSSRPPSAMADELAGSQGRFERGTLVTEWGS